MALVAAPDQRLGGVFGVVGAAGEIVAQLTPGGDQLGERLGGTIRARGPKTQPTNRARASASNRSFMAIVPHASANWQPRRGLRR